MITKPVEVTIPDRLYRAILATWCAAVFGAALLIGGRAFPATTCSESTTTVGGFSLAQPSAVTLQALQKEIAEIRSENDELRKQLAQLTSD